MNIPVYKNLKVICPHWKEKIKITPFNYTKKESIEKLESETIKNTTRAKDNARKNLRCGNTKNRK